MRSSRWNQSGPGSTGSSGGAAADLCRRSCCRTGWRCKSIPDPVAGAGITALRAPVVEVFEDLQALLHDAVGLLPLDVDHEPDPAAVFFVPGIIKSLLGW